MYLRFTRRRKNGKEHRYWSIVESRRCTGGRVVQRPVLDLGEINDSQHGAWSRVIEAFDEESQRPRQLALFPAERRVPDHAAGFGVQVRLNAMELHRPRQWGACWLACHLYEQLELDRFWTPRLPDSREGTRDGQPSRFHSIHTHPSPGVFGAQISRRRVRSVATRELYARARVQFRQLSA